MFKKDKLSTKNDNNVRFVQVKFLLIQDSL